MKTTQRQETFNNGDFGLGRDSRPVDRRSALKIAGAAGLGLFLAACGDKQKGGGDQVTITPNDQDPGDQDGHRGDTNPSVEWTDEMIDADTQDRILRFIDDGRLPDPQLAPLSYDETMAKGCVSPFGEQEPGCSDNDLMRGGLITLLNQYIGSGGPTNLTCDDIPPWVTDADSAHRFATEVSFRTSGSYEATVFTSEKVGPTTNPFIGPLVNKYLQFRDGIFAYSMEAMRQDPKAQPIKVTFEAGEDISPPVNAMIIRANVTGGTPDAIEALFAANPYFSEIRAGQPVVTATDVGATSHDSFPEAYTVYGFDANGDGKPDRAVRIASQFILKGAT